MNKYLFFLLLLVFSYACNANDTLQTTNIKEQLKKIPLEERVELEHFFRFLLQKAGFGYTLFGDKPITLECFPCFYQIESLTPMPLKNGWKKWKKYQHLFPSCLFVLDDHIICIDEEEKASEYIEIYLVNILEFNKTVEKHKTLFDEKIISEKNNEKKIRKILDMNPSFPNFHEILGVLLGYGQKNSHEFQKRQNTFEKLCSLCHPPQLISRKILDLPKEEILSLAVQQQKNAISSPLKLAEQEKLIKEHLSSMQSGLPFSSIANKNPLSLVSLPTFTIYDQGNETKKLYEKYAKARKKIANILNSQQFLEEVLSQICAVKHF